MKEILMHPFVLVFGGFMVGAVTMLVVLAFCQAARDHRDSVPEGDVVGPGGE